MEFTLEEIVRATNVPSDVSGTTAIQFYLTYLVMLVKESVGMVILNLEEKYRIKAEKQPEENVTMMMSDPDKQQQTSQPMRE